MKKSTVSNRTKIILTTIALLLSLVGSTYAWWTSYVETKQRITMGNLSITADFQPIDPEIYEPGTSVELSGQIKNTGTIPALVKIENSSTIQFAYTDDSLTVIPAGNRTFVADDANAVKVSLQPKSGLYNDPQNTSVYWFKDAKNTSYLLMDPKATVNVLVHATFDGTVMGSKYQDALIEVGAKLKATQVIDGAIASEFGISSNELIGLDDQASIKGRAVQGKAVDYLHQLLQRK